MAVAGPNDVLDVQSVVLLLVAVPHADLTIPKEWRSNDYLIVAETVPCNYNGDSSPK